MSGGSGPQSGQEAHRQGGEDQQGEEAAAGVPNSRTASVSRRLGAFFSGHGLFSSSPFCIFSSQNRIFVGALPLNGLHGDRAVVVVDALHPPVLHVDHLVCHGGYGAVVGDDHHRHALLAAGVLEQLQDRLAGDIVQCPRWARRTAAAWDFWPGPGRWPPAAAHRRRAGPGSCSAAPPAPHGAARPPRPGGPGRSGRPAPRFPGRSGSEPGCRTGTRSRCHIGGMW